jgi:hypothetical protein
MISAIQNILSVNMISWSKYHSKMTLPVKLSVQSVKSKATEGKETTIVMD